MVVLNNHNDAISRELLDEDLLVIQDLHTHFFTPDGVVRPGSAYTCHPENEPSTWQVVHLSTFPARP